MLAYGVVFSAFLSLYHFSLVKDKHLRFLAYCSLAVLMALFSGLRADVGVDDINYKAFFVDVEPLYEVLMGGAGYSSKPRPYEPGYYYLMSFFKVVSSDFLLFKLFLSSLTVGIVAWAYRLLSRHCYIIFFIFSATLYLSIVMHQIRNGLSLALVLLAFAYLIRNKVGIYYLLVCLASSVHLSALPLLVLPVFLKIPFNFKIFCLFFSTALLFKYMDGLSRLLELVLGISSGGQDIVSRKLEGKAARFSQDQYGIVFGVGIIKTLLILCFYLWLQRFKSAPDFIITIVKIYFVGTCMFIAVSDMNLIAARINRNFMMLEPILIVYIAMAFRSQVIKYFIPLGYFMLSLLKDRHQLFDFPYSTPLIY